MSGRFHLRYFKDGTWFLMIFRTCRKKELSKDERCAQNFLICTLSTSNVTLPYNTKHVSSHYVTFNTFNTFLLYTYTFYNINHDIMKNIKFLINTYNNLKVTFSFARPACLVISRAILAPLPSAIVQVIESTDVYVWLFSEQK